MKDRTFNIAFASFPYGGNGGMSNEYPAVRNFLIEVISKAKSDPRIDEIHQRDFSDTPITMTRNQAVLWARQVGADFLLMIDSDMEPDCELREDLEAKPFWDTSFDFCVKHYDDGPNVVCAPYCGPPPISNVYVFYWSLDENDCLNDRGSIDQYSREQAAMMRGIQPVAAQPTGLILFDMRAFELTDPANFYKHLRQQGKSVEEAKALVHPWFYYEYSDIYQTQKCSTEDVTATRDMSFHGWVATGRETIYCNWDAWAGHVKPKVVRKPRPLDAKAMHAQYRHVVQENQTFDRKMIFVDPGSKSEKPSRPEQSVEESDRIIHIGMHTPLHDLDALSLLVGTNRPNLAVEVGSWVGESALAICQALPEGGKLICVDAFLGSSQDGSGRVATMVGPDAVKEAFLANTAEFREKGVLQLWEMLDSDAVRKFDYYQNSQGTAPKIDFLYLDADHEYDFVKRQIEKWTPLMSEDGIIAGHDFEVGFPGVEKAVRECFSEFTHIEGTAVWYARVKDRNLKPQNGKVHERVS